MRVRKGQQQMCLLASQLVGVRRISNKCAVRYTSSGNKEGLIMCC